jgi:hypothetical protein
MKRLQIKDYEGLYEVSEEGNIINLKKNKALTNVSAGRYLVVLLYKNNKRKMYYVHRLVAEAFCEKQEGKIQVNHKDLDRYNNHYYNLEWVSSKENVMHFVSSKKYKPRSYTEEQKQEAKVRNYKKVICLETNKVFDSMGHFANYRGISLAQASQKLNNRCANNLNAVLI